MSDIFVLLQISLLLVVLLYLLSYWLVAKFKRHRTKEECYSGN